MLALDSLSYLLKNSLLLLLRYGFFHMPLPLIPVLLYSAFSSSPISIVHFLSSVRAFSWIDINKITKDKNASSAQVSMAWMFCKKTYIVPIPGTRKSDRLRENMGAADVMLTAEEVQKLDEALDKMPMSAAFGCTK